MDPETGRTGEAENDATPAWPSARLRAQGAQTNARVTGQRLFGAPERANGPPGPANQAAAESHGPGVEPRATLSQGLTRDIRATKALGAPDVTGGNALAPDEEGTGPAPSPTAPPPWHAVDEQLHAHEEIHGSPYGEPLPEPLDGGLIPEAHATLPTLRFSAEERATGRLRPYTISRAAAAFRFSGCLVLEDLIAPGLMAKLHTAYEKRYASYYRDRSYSDALQVGGRRFMVTVTLRPPFSSPEVFANPLLLPILRRLLGEGFILGSFGSVLALSGAAEQHVHRDHGLLFGDQAVESTLPPFAVTVLLPLVELNTTNGTTRVWPGSHLQGEEPSRSLEAEEPRVAPGSCLLLDYRLRHGGTENRSKRARPVLYSVYQRPWFTDVVNFKKQAPLRVSRSVFRELPASERALLSRASVEGWLGRSRG